MTLKKLLAECRSVPGVAVGAGCTDAELVRAERELAVAFPKPLREYLRDVGWLTVGSNELYGLGADIRPSQDLVAATRWERTQAAVPIPNDLIPLVNDGAGNHYCVQTENSSIVFWAHDVGADQDVQLVAHGLTAWIRSLLDEHRSPPPDVATLIRELARAGWRREVLDHRARMHVFKAIAELLAEIDDEAELRRQFQLRFAVEPPSSAGPLRVTLASFAGELMG